jgi:putative hydrolase of HD superfamily
MIKKINNILFFLNLTEKLKSTLRHGWTSTGRQESVAEHSWRVSLMIILLSPYLKEKIIIEKALKMAIIHDLAECKTGDIHFFEIKNDITKKNKKYENEKKIMIEMKKVLDNEMGEELFNLWIEFEENISYEAKFVLAVDKLEAHLQHNEANIDTWTEEEKESVFTGYLNEFVVFDPFLGKLKDEIILQSKGKLQIIST